MCVATPGCRAELSADPVSIPAGIDDISDSLVPGDIVDISDPSLNTFPADLVLLSGDAIVNESMLTGESVPVSKYPVEQEGVSWISSPGAEVDPELSRHVVFSGTKIIRIRKTTPPPGSGGAPELEAIAMVMRTGRWLCLSGRRLDRLTTLLA